MIPGTFWRPYELAPLEEAAQRFQDGHPRWIAAGAGTPSRYRLGSIGIPQPLYERRAHDTGIIGKYREPPRRATYRGFGTDGQEAMICTLTPFKALENGPGPERPILVTTPVNSLDWIGDDPMAEDRFSGLGGVSVRAVEVVSTERLRLIRHLSEIRFDGALVTIPRLTIADLSIGPLSHPHLVQAPIDPMPSQRGPRPVNAFHLFIANEERVTLGVNGRSIELLVDEGELHVFTPAFAKRWLR